MDIIRIPIEQLSEEPMTCNHRSRYSHPAFTRKIPKGITPSDYDKKEKLIEVELQNFERAWIPVGTCFGKAIGEAEVILLLHPDGDTERLSIADIDVIKIKRTAYWKLIFERIIPFQQQPCLIQN